MHEKVVGDEQKIMQKLFSDRKMNNYVTVPLEEPAPPTRLSSVTCYLGRAGGEAGASICMGDELELERTKYR
jgi:hypothetical protein